MALRSLCTLKSLAAALTLVATLGVASPASAAIIWNWSFGRTEAGTFTTTDGDTSTVAFTIIGFSVTASSTPGLIGSTMVAGENVQGFLWDGSAPTQFFRAQYTNGANFFKYSLDRWYGFNPGTSMLVAGSTYTYLARGALTLSPVTPLPQAPPPPPPPTTVPEPMALTLLALGGVGMVVRQRRQR